MAGADGSGPDAEHGADLGGRHLFQVPHDQELAVVRAEPVHGILDAPDHLVADQLTAGTGAIRFQQVRQGIGRWVGQQQAVLFLAEDAAAMAPDMVAMQSIEPLPGQLPQPGIERQGPLPQVIGEIQGGVHERLLDHIRGVDPGGQAAVEMHGDHLAEAAPMAGQQALAGRAIAMFRRAEQLVGVGMARFHGC